MNIKDEILDYIGEYKNQNEFGYELSDEEIIELEKVKDDFCHEVGRIIGSCKMEMKDEGISGYKTLKIYRTKN